jgi:4-hydroxybenzoate polyprenyltransferase
MTGSSTSTSVPADAVPPPRPAGLALLRALRPHQWAKNALLLTPALLAHLLPWQSESAARQWTQLLAATAAFCLMASAVYVVNDLVDLAADRQHPHKRRRPFAAGELSPHRGPLIALVLVLASGALAALAPPQFWGILVGYAALSLAYSLWLKRKMLVDVFLLAALYTLRLIAGGAAAEVPVSNWMLAFSIFLFTSLAFAKRYVELDRSELDDTTPVAGRAYRRDDLAMIASAGPASAYLAVLVLALYVNDSSGAARSLYRAPLFLWLLCPLMMYWTTRIWFFAHRRALDEDPIAFALHDRISWLVLIVAGLLVVAAWQPWNG